MDLLNQLNQVADPQTRDLLTHGIRYALTHNLIANQAISAKDNPQANQAAAIHQETAAVLNALVAKMLETAEKIELPEAPEAPKTRKSKNAS